MRKLLFFFAVSTLAVLPTIADDKDRGSDDLIGASARLLPIDDSGIKAKALFIDSGAPFNILVVSASATGLDPTKNYISLLYDNASVPTGPNACEPGDGSHSFSPWGYIALGRSIAT